MKPPCTIVASQVLPAVRVVVARALIETHELKPTLVASKMGLTPAAVTQYVSGVRGGRLVSVIQGSKKVGEVLDELVEELLKVHPDRHTVLAAVCELCRAVRKERMLCQFCDGSVGVVGADQCDLCLQLSR